MRLKPVHILLLIYAVLALITIGLFDGTGDSGDSILHYLHAKYAIEHPENLVKHWAKPIFTLFALPFAQLGFVGMKLMNAIITGLSLYFTVKCGEKLNLKNSIAAGVILLFSPLYYSLTFSGLTEPMFALFLSLGLYGILSQRLHLSAFIFSFLPFVRTEGYIILVVVALYFILKNNWKVLPYLTIGTLVYSVIGSFYYDDIFWVFSKVPYVATEDVYGKGNLFHFVDQLIYVIGVPNYILFWLGLLLLILRTFKKPFNAELSILVIGGFLTYFIAHSLFWYLGGFNSLGLKRVLIGLMPLIGIICLFAFNFLSENLTSGRDKISRIVQFSLVTLIVIFPFTNNHAALQLERDLSLKKDQQLALELADYLQSNNLSERRIVCAPTYFCEILDVDPFDGRQRLNLTKSALRVLKKGDILIWDDWYTGFENQVPLSLLSQSNDLNKLHYLELQDGGRLIQYHVFEKL